MAIVLLLVIAWLAVTGSPAVAAACAQRVDLALESIRDTSDAVDRMHVRVTAASSIAGGDRPVRVKFTSVSNAEVRIGAAIQPVPSTVTLPAGVNSWTFTLTQL